MNQINQPNDELPETSLDPIEPIEPIDPVMVKFNEINDYFGGKLPNPIHYPIQFQHYLTLYSFYQQRGQTTNGSI